MKASEVLEVLFRGVPKKAEWSKGEPYGPYSVDPNLDIQRILYAVTPTDDVVRYFLDNDYDLLISHHPMIVGNRIPQVILHTALDCCEGGLNDQWRDAIGLLDAKHFDGTLGWYGRIEPVSFGSLIKRCEAFAGDLLIGQTYSEIEMIESVVICSGLGGLVTDLARSTGADCYILGEATDPAAEMGFRAVIETGHTLSERCGANLLRKLLPELVIDNAPLMVDYFGREHYHGERL